MLGHTQSHDDNNNLNSYMSVTTIHSENKLFTQNNGIRFHHKSSWNSEGLS